jgi:hypothetical protein
LGSKTQRAHQEFALHSPTQDNVIVLLPPEALLQVILMLNTLIIQPSTLIQTKAHSQGLFHQPLDAPQRCTRRGLLSQASTGMMSAAIPLSIQDNRRFSVHLKVYGLPFNLGLRNLESLSAPVYGNPNTECSCAHSFLTGSQFQKQA